MAQVKMETFLFAHIVYLHLIQVKLLCGLITALSVVQEWTVITMLDYVVMSEKQFEEYARVLMSGMGAAEKDGRLPNSERIAFDIFIHAPLPSIVVKVSDIDIQITYKRNGEELSCKIEHKKYDGVLYVVFKADVEKKGIFVVSSDMPESKLTRQILLIYTTVQSLLIEPQHYMKQSKEALPNHKTHKQKGKKYKPAQKVTVYRIIDCDEPKQKRLERTVKKREWRCLAWGVRGHYRHYKSGKTIFVHAFTKGKNKEAYKGREYVLVRKEQLK